MPDKGVNLTPGGYTHLEAHSARVAPRVGHTN